MTDELLTFLETSALIASTEDLSLEEYLEACAQAYCEVHRTVLVECVIEATVEDKPEAN